jgi:hypothetical protein
MSTERQILPFPTTTEHIVSRIELREVEQGTLLTFFFECGDFESKLAAEDYSPEVYLALINSKVLVVRSPSGGVNIVKV